MIERLQEEEPEHVSKPCPGARWSGREEFVAVFLHGGAIFGVRPRACNIHSPGLQAFLVQKLTNLESRSFAALHVFLPCIGPSRVWECVYMSLGEVLPSRVAG